ncbi:MAG: hypothetical protein LBO09_06115 [Candidatus Peribacteria bacterium]|jgi:hypothetical protein|nr:hypothetical protein [Candidatus Peribacteria bacterium]
MKKTETKLLLPKEGVLLPENGKYRLYFLAGPIRGGGDWQKKAIQLLMDYDPGCYVACPCWYQKEASLLPYQMASNDHCLFFERQTLWERYYLREAIMHGCIIFWLPIEDPKNPRKKEDGPYARETYGEIGRWSMKAFIQGAHPIFGAEKGFSGLDQIHVNLCEDFWKKFPIYDSLEKTIKKAVKYAKERNKFHKAYDPEKDAYPYSAYLSGDYRRQDNL